jgi:hypothetical protein
MADDGDFVVAKLMDELGKVVDHVLHVVISIADPVRIAVAAMVEGDDVPVLTQFLRHPVPAARMIAPAMDEHQQRFFGIAPIEVIEAQALRDEGLRGGSGESHASGLKSSAPLRKPVRPIIAPSSPRISAPDSSLPDSRRPMGSWP